jgi:hypothetical protein
VSGFYHQDERDQATNVGCLVLIVIPVAIVSAILLAMAIG